MIDFKTIKVGDKVKVIGAGAPGFAMLGDVLEIVKVEPMRVDAKRADGEECYFALTCGAARLELVRDDSGGIEMSEKHDVIYLQAGDADGEDLWTGSDVSWCKDRIFESDVEYIRADLVAALKLELENERMKVVACGVVAMANTRGTAEEARKMLPEYRSASLNDVERAVDREMQHREDLAALKSQLAQEPVAICDADCRLRFEYGGIVRYASCPPWISIGTKLYTTPHHTDEVERDNYKKQVAMLRNALWDQLNDCINFNGGQLTTSIMEASTKTLNATQDLSEQEESMEWKPIETHEPQPNKLLFKCSDCGHVQQVSVVYDMYGGRYFGSGANWCDVCDTGKPELMEQQSTTTSSEFSREGRRMNRDLLEELDWLQKQIRADALFKDFSQESAGVSICTRAIKEIERLRTELTISRTIEDDSRREVTKLAYDLSRTMTVNEGMRRQLAEIELVPVYAFRRKGQNDFCTCSMSRFLECCNQPLLFETAIFYRKKETSQ